MAINRLQLTLIAEDHPLVRAALPVEIRVTSIELVARMLLGLVRDQRANGTSKEMRDESR